jgi:hypothetical protein
MRLKRLTISALSVFFLLVFSRAALGCACCAEPGTYILSTARPDTFYLELLSELEFDRSAKLFLTEAGFDSIKGLKAVRSDYESADYSADSDSFKVNAAFVNGIWRFGFKNARGRVGSLTFPLPPQMVSFKVDIHDSEDRGNGPLLYKELRFKGKLSKGTGIMADGAARTASYFLVFQGRGTGCDNAEDFTHWRLEISGPNSSYAFYGKFGEAEGPGKVDVLQ